MLRPRLTLAAALAAGTFAVSAAPALADQAPSTSDAVQALQQQAATRDLPGADGLDPATLVTRLLGLPGQGSLEALLEAGGLPHDQAADLARKLSALSTTPTVPGGGDTSPGGD